MTLFDPNRCQTIYLSDARLMLQRDEIALLSSEITFELMRDWTFQVAIPLDCSQQLLQTWQRMIHEPTYSQPGPGDQRTQSQSSSYVLAHPLQQDQYASLTGKNEAQGYQTDHLAGASVGFVGNNERGERRVVYLEGIRELEIAIDTFQLHQAIVRFRCLAAGGLDAILYINDGSDLSH